MTLSLEKYPELQALLATGAEITLENNGQVVARVTPVATTRGRPIAGLLHGKIRIAPDFDQTPQELIDLFENGNVFPKD
jgi:antitoxin (DNA-binding transcriptional repressor) of toxin-antitoxin stability system